MQSIEQKRKRRFEFLHKLYQDTKANTLSQVNYYELGEELGFDKETTDAITRFLADEQLVRHWTLGNVSITHYGVTEIERALSKPEESTQYFPAINLLSGDFRGAVVNLDSYLQNVTQYVVAVPSLSEAEQSQLQELINQLNKILTETPEELKNDKDIVNYATQTLVEEAAAGSKNTPKIKVTIDGLVKAAENIAKLTKEIMPVVTGILTLLGYAGLI